jgi:hypothetical protein
LADTGQTNRPSITPKTPARRATAKRTVSSIAILLSNLCWFGKNAVVIGAAGWVCLLQHTGRFYAHRLMIIVACWAARDRIIRPV